MNELDLFVAAIAITDRDQRAALVDKECGWQPDLRARLDNLISAQFQSNALRDAQAINQPSSHADSGTQTVTMHPPTESVVALIAGRYKLLEEIGEAGMGAMRASSILKPGTGRGGRSQPRPRIQSSDAR
jgi:hypothetical protein